MLTPRPTKPKCETISLHLTPDEAELLEVVLDGVREEADTSPEYRETAFLLRAQLDGARDVARSIDPANDGSGLAEHDPRVDCPECGGTRVRGRQTEQGAWITVPCALCKGSGQISDFLYDLWERQGM